MRWYLYTKNSSYSIGSIGITAIQKNMLTNPDTNGLLAKVIKVREMGALI